MWIWVKMRYHFGKKYKLDRTRANNLWIIRSRPVQNRVTELLVCRILQENDNLLTLIRVGSDEEYQHI